MWLLFHSFTMVLLRRISDVLLQIRSGKFARVCRGRFRGEISITATLMTCLIHPMTVKLKARRLTDSVCGVVVTVGGAIGAAPNSQPKDKFNDHACGGAIVIDKR